MLTSSSSGFDMTSWLAGRPARGFDRETQLNCQVTGALTGISPLVGDFTCSQLPQNGLFEKSCPTIPFRFVSWVLYPALQSHFFFALRCYEI